MKRIVLLLQFCLMVSSQTLFAEEAFWTYNETNTVQNGTSHGYITDNVWTFYAERAKGSEKELTVNASKGVSINTEALAKIDFTKINYGFKVVAFYGWRNASSPLCKYVTEFIAPHCTTFGGEDTFSGNTNLTRVEFCKDEPLNISSVNRCFLSCVNLVDFRPRQIKGSVGSMFNNCSNLEGRFEIEGNGGTPSGVFAGCVKLGEIELKNIDTFSQDAFSGCTSLSNIVYDTPIANIGNSAFKNCTKITTEFVQSLLGKNLVRWGNSPTDRKHCFDGCTGLTGTIVIDLPNLVTNVVPYRCFYGCSSLERVVIKSKNLCDIDKEAFYAISNGAEVVMPKNVIKGRFGEMAVLNNDSKAYNVPYPKICLIGDVEAYLDKINETHHIIRKADFENSAWVHHDLASGVGGSKPSYDDVITTMSKDEAMCTITKVDGKNKVKLLDKRIVGFIYYQKGSIKTTGCWILAEPKLGFTVTVR